MRGWGCELHLPDRRTRMNMHKNARLTPQGRALMISRIVDHGWRVADAAQAAGLSTRRAYIWLARFRAGDERMLHDRSSAPVRKPRSTPAKTVATIEALRRQRLSGPAIALRLGLPRSTVGAILRRIGLGRLDALDVRPPSCALRAPAPGRTDPHRHQEARPHRRRRPSHHRRSRRTEPQPRHRLGMSACGDRRRLAARLHRSPAQTRPRRRPAPS